MNTTTGWYRRATDAYIQRRFAVLFYSLLLSVALVPLLEALGVGTELIRWLLAGNLLLAAGTTERPSLRWAVVIAVCIMVAEHLQSTGPQDSPRALAGLGLWSVIAVIAAANALRFSLQAPEVRSEQMHAALGAYLLIGLFFGLAYSVLEKVAPGSFALAGQAFAGDLREAVAIYFSFVTLATLGYGDIVPLTASARGLVVIEAIGGQLYIAVLVARLVSLHR